MRANSEAEGVCAVHRWAGGHERNEPVEWSALIAEGRLRTVRRFGASGLSTINQEDLTVFGQQR